MTTQTVSGFWLKGIIACAESQGVSQNAILTEAGVAQLPASANERVPLDATVNIWDAAIKLTQDTLFGFHMGKQFRPNWFHLIHMIWSNCPDVRTAINTVLNYQALVSDGGHLNLVETDSQAIIEYQPKAANLPFSHHQIDAVLTILVSLMRWSINEQFHPSSIHLSYTQNLNHSNEEFESFFHCPIHYESTVPQVCLKKSWLDEPMLGADQELLEMHLELANQKLSELKPASLKDQIHLMMIRQKSFAPLNKEEVATQLGISPRTLQRRLKEQSTSFSELTDTLRKELAIELIQQKEKTNTLVERLAFSEVSSLHKACKRWFKMSLQEYRTLKDD